MEPEKIYILTMHDSDGDISYYHVPPNWYDWIKQPSTQQDRWGFNNIPTELKDAFESDYEPIDTLPIQSLCDIRQSLQILAVDETYIGSSSNLLIKWLQETNNLNKKITDLEGYWY